MADTESMQDVIPTYDRVNIARRMNNHAEKGMENDDPCFLPGHCRQSWWKNRACSGGQETLPPRL